MNEEKPKRTASEETRKNLPKYLKMIGKIK